MSTFGSDKDIFGQTAADYASAHGAVVKVGTARKCCKQERCRSLGVRTAQTISAAYFLKCLVNKLVVCDSGD